jgi:hypothetical protein
VISPVPEPTLGELGEGSRKEAEGITMQFKHCVVVLCLLSLTAIGQNSAGDSPGAQTPIQGIKILSSTFDSSASPQRIQLEFINDTLTDITAWAYCVNAEKINDADPSQAFCTAVDPMSLVVDREVQEKMTLKPHVGDCPDCNFIHPGERKILSANFSTPVKTAEIQLNFVAYSNGQAEVSGPLGSSNLQNFSRGRQRVLELTQEVRDLGNRILADPTDQHPAVTMINELQSRSRNVPWLEAALRNFKKPEWRHGNNKEFIPDNQRDYLGKFVAEQAMKAAEFSKYQLKEGSQ